MTARASHPRTLLHCLLALLLLAAAGAAAAQQPLRLDGAAGSIDAWPALLALPEADTELTLDEARRRRADFALPAVPANNFGPRRGGVWLLLPLQVTSDSSHWILEVDYPPLNRIDLWLLRDGRVERRLKLGNTVPAAERPMRSRSHAAALELEPGAAYEVMLRIESSSALVVPIRLHTAAAFVGAESARLLLQGLMFGVTLMLLASSLVNGFSLRDRVFGFYALMIVGVGLFFLSFSGLGHQFLWPAHAGLLAKVSPWGALLGSMGASLFATGALELQRHRPRAAAMLRAIALAGGVVIVASALGLLDYRQTSLAATVLGPIPVVVALYESLRRARQGDPVAVYMALGWGAYTVGALSMAAVLRGLVAVDFWVQHLFQFASVIEMFAWMRVLSLRIADVQRQAERVAAEKRTLQSLAFTDPLTGLPNRRGLAAALETALPAARPDSMLVVYLLDLDGFKAVNDRLGHDAGDALLVQVARRLKSVLRSADTVARLGGDEFVVMSTAVAAESAALTVGRKMLEAMRAPFEVDGQTCSVGLTIGFAIAPLDGNDAGDLLRRADAAMYAGKQGGRNCVRRGGASAGLAAG